MHKQKVPVILLLHAGYKKNVNVYEWVCDGVLSFCDSVKWSLLCCENIDICLECTITSALAFSKKLKSWNFKQFFSWYYETRQNKTNIALKRLLSSIGINMSHFISRLRLIKLSRQERKSRSRKQQVNLSGESADVANAGGCTLQRTKWHAQDFVPAICSDPLATVPYSSLLLLLTGWILQSPLQRLHEGGNENAAREGGERNRRCGSLELRICSGCLRRLVISSVRRFPFRWRIVKLSGVLTQ